VAKTIRRPSEFVCETKGGKRHPGLLRYIGDRFPAAVLH
jgi:hypothetical protein